MPKFNKEYAQTLEDAGREKKNYSFIGLEKLKEIASSHKLEHLGDGTEFAVFALEGGDHILAIAYEGLGG